MRIIAASQLSLLCKYLTSASSSACPWHCPPGHRSCVPAVSRESRPGGAGTCIYPEQVSYNLRWKFQTYRALNLKFNFKFKCQMLTGFVRVCLINLHGITPHWQQSDESPRHQVTPAPGQVRDQTPDMISSTPGHSSHSHQTQNHPLTHTAPEPIRD